ncbi:M56 family metallopeptidase [Chryseobacterium tructae]|uniref:M56 family metallopeptidase n=1 Tax=Chryseobacterium tructae TaxID=1037380 RepID=A0ABV7XSC2_9FLAO|nr:M56 family metallopeptidase [Chryseobacterium tructae]MDN3695721.1 M56 family metallopeptidase [Chryseobacterium tructae]
MYRFNRIYLLSSLILSYVIPFITFTIQTPKATRPQLIIEEAVQYVVTTQHRQESFNWMNLIWSVYLIVTFFILAKSILSFLVIKRIQGKKSSYQNYNIIITQKKLSPFSFWNTIYIGKEYIKNDTIDPRIFLHEKSHIDQKHSIDLILIHIVKIFTWFNPVLFLYKKAVITNHEFLADEAVLNQKFNLKEYQNLILDELIESQNLPFTHSLSFNNTKKRFIMMKSQKTKFSLLRKTVGITTLVAATALLSERTYANTSVRTENNTELEHASSPIKTSNTETTKVVEYSMKSLPEDILQEKTAIAPTALKKEIIKPVADTISPKKDQEGKNTNIQDDKNFVSAEYPNSMAELRAQIGKTIDLSALESVRGVIKATAYVHIDKTGKASQVTTSGDNDIFNKELLKTITAISNETSWKPATKDGQPIASVLKIPTTMNLTKP